MGSDDHRRTTIADVARAAGVAPSTVSRAFSRPGRVATSTAERIWAAAEELDYRQLPVRPIRRTSPTSLLTMVVADVMNPVFAAMVKGAHHEATEHDYDLLLVDSEESRATERSTLERAMATTDGLILAGTRMSDTAVRHFAQAQPVVTLNRCVPGVSSVIVDSPRGIAEALSQLRSLGHHNLSYLAGPSDSWEEGVRWRVVADFAHQGPARVHRIASLPPTLEGGYRAVERWLSDRTTAVLAYNDLMAIGFIRALGAHGIAVPHEVSVVGFDDISYAELLTPPLTTIRTDGFAEGREAVRIVTAGIRAGHRGRGRVHGIAKADTIVIPAPFMDRGSVAPPGQDLTRLPS